MANQHGFTLLELLISLGLSTFILSGVYLFFNHQNQIYGLQQTLIQEQEIGRVAVNLLRDRIRQAGGLGCTHWHAQLPVYRQAQSIAEWLPQTANAVIHSYTAQGIGWQPPLPSYLLNKVRENTDVIVLHHAYAEAGNLLEHMSNPQAPLALPLEMNLQVGDVLLLADCEQMDILQISALSRQGDHWSVMHQPPYNQSPALSKAYHQDAIASVLQSAAYYIGNTGRRYKNGDTIFALYQFTGHHQELVEGVADLQVHYGVDINADQVVDTMLSTVPALGQGVLHRVDITLQTHVNAKRQTWPLQVSLRN